MQKLEDFDKLYKGYITRTFHSKESTSAKGEWIAADTIMDLERRRNEHRRYVLLTIIRL